eukprot:scaffold619_cov403-Prasinococcus_capsulatus_cf.AAC.14
MSFRSTVSDSLKLFPDVFLTTSGAGGTTCWQGQHVGRMLRMYACYCWTYDTGWGWGGGGDYLAVNHYGVGIPFTQRGRAHHNRLIRTPYHIDCILHKRRIAVAHTAGADAPHAHNSLTLGSATPSKRRLVDTSRRPLTEGGVRS